MTTTPVLTESQLQARAHGLFPVADIRKGDRFLYLDIVFEAAEDAYVEPAGVSREPAVFVPVTDGSELRLYSFTVTRLVFSSHPDAKFRAGDMIQARNGRGYVYEICYLFFDHGVLSYRTDSGAVTIHKRGMIHCEAGRADRGYRLVR